MSISDEARKLLNWLGEQYIKAGYPNHKVWTFSPLPAHRALFAELRAHGYAVPFGAGNVEWRLTDLGQQTILEAAQRGRKETTGTMSDSLLSHDEILQLRAAVVSAGLGESRRALLAHISAEFVASLPVAPAPGGQVLMDLDALNSVGELADRSVPLRIWLANAMELSGGRQEVKLFEAMLVRCGGTPSARTKPTTSTGKASDQPAAAVVHHHHGDTHMGDKYTVTTTNSTIGAQAIGKNAHAVGHVAIGGATDSITKEQHLALLQEIQMALIASQQKLDEIDGRLFDALNQFLRLARNVEVEQKGMSEIQVKMKDTLDEVAAKHFADGLRPKLLPKTLGVAEALVKSPVMGEVVKKLLGA